MSESRQWYIKLHQSARKVGQSALMGQFSYLRTLRPLYMVFLKALGPTVRLFAWQSRGLAEEGIKQTVINDNMLNNFIGGVYQAHIIFLAVLLKWRRDFSTIQRCLRVMWSAYRWRLLAVTHENVSIGGGLKLPRPCGITMQFIIIFPLAAGAWNYVPSSVYAKACCNLNWL